MEDRVRFVELVDQDDARLAVEQIAREGCLGVGSAEQVRRELVVVEHGELLAEERAAEQPIDELCGLGLAHAGRAVKHEDDGLRASRRG